MTIQHAIDQADQLKPNYMDRPMKVAMLQELDQLIYNEILLKHEHTQEEEVPPEYSGDRTGETVLLVPEPYSMVYIYWLMSKIDLMNQELDKYNNDRALFENAYDTMSDWWTRTRMPVTTNPWFVV